MASANTTGNHGDVARRVPLNPQLNDAMPRAYTAVTSAVVTVYSSDLRRITRMSISWKRMIA